MPLTEADIKDIGQRTGEHVFIQSKCRERAEFIQDIMNDIFEHELSILQTAASPKKAKKEMLFQIDSYADTLKEYYPDVPMRSMLLKDLGEMRDKATKTDKNDPLSTIKEVTQDLDDLHDNMLVIMLDDFKQCECQR